MPKNFSPQGRVELQITHFPYLLFLLRGTRLCSVLACVFRLGMPKMSQYMPWCLPAGTGQGVTVRVGVRVPVRVLYYSPYAYSFVPDDHGCMNG